MKHDRYEHFRGVKTLQRRSALRIGLASLFLLWLSCSAAPGPGMATRPAEAATASGQLSLKDVKVRKLVDSGGRVAWYKGDQADHELIAFDAIVNWRRNTEIFTIRPDGSGRRCVTCDSPIPKGFVGQPAWHPNGEYILLQAENEHSRHGTFNHVSFGIDNDLWIIRRDGTGAQKLWSPQQHGGALHPHFSKDGKTLIFSERVPTGRKLRRFFQRRLAPGGENPWHGWRIHIARFELKDGGGRLYNHRQISPRGAGFYETHGFTPDGKITFSFTSEERSRRGGYVDDVYSATLEGGELANLTNGEETWDEHGLYSPDGRYLAFNSSRYDRSLRFPGPKAADLVMELYIQPKGGKPIQLTNMNERKGKKIVISDFDWDRTSTRLVLQVATLPGRTPPEIWILHLP